MTALNGILDKRFFNENTLKYKHMCFTRRSRTTKHKMTRPFDLLGMFELQIYKYSLLSLKKPKQMSWEEKIGLIIISTNVFTLHHFSPDIQNPYLCILRTPFSTCCPNQLFH